MRKKIIFTFLCIGFIFNSFAQEYLKYIPEYDFIDSAYNRIIIPENNSERFQQLIQKIDSLVCYETGRVNILHIGGSHVQAGSFPHRIRENLDYINGQHQTPYGFIFPFLVAETNNPAHYSVSYKGKWEACKNTMKSREVSLGMSGIAVFTQDPEAEIKIDLNPKKSFKRWNFNELYLLGNTADGSEKVQSILQYKDSMAVTGIYDPVACTYHFRLPEPAHAFTISFRQQDSIPHTFILNGFVTNNDTPGIVYHSIGVNGAFSTSYLSCENFENDLKLISPDLIIFGIGVNDATSQNFTKSQFIQNYDSLIEKIEKISPGCAYIFITNNDSFQKKNKWEYEVNKNGLVAREAFYALAEKYQGGVWDQFSLMGGLGSIKKWEKAGLAKKDKVHFTRAGYTLLGDLFYNAFMKFYIQEEN